MALLLRQGGLGMRMQTDKVSDTAFVAGAGHQHNLNERPAALCPLHGDSGASESELWSNLHKRCAEQFKWHAAAKDLPAEILGSRNWLLEARLLVNRKGDDACHSDMLSGFDLYNT